MDRIREACAAVKGDCVLGFASDQILLRVIELPAVDDEELAGMVELQADKFSPFPVESMVISHEVLARDEASCAVAIAVARGDVVDAQGRVLTDAGLRPVRMDACVMGWWHALQAADVCPPDARCIHLVLDGNLAEIIVVEQGVARVFRTLPLAAGADAAALASDLGQELGHTLISFELEHGAAPAPVTVWSRGEAHAGVAAALQAEPAWDVTGRSLDDLAPACEGIARRTLTRDVLDLTPPSWIEAVTRRRQRNRMLGGLLGVAALWVVLVAALSGLYVFERNRLSRLDRELERWRPPAMEVRELRRKVLLIERYADISHSALECLREVSEAQPDGIDLSSFSYNKQDAVRVVGAAAQRSLIYDFKRNLDGSKLFTSVELGSLNQDRRQQLWSFDVVLHLPKGET